MKSTMTPPARHPASTLFLHAVCYILIGSFLCIQPAYAQLQGTYTIGGSNGDYASFTEATQALETHGVSAPVTFKVRPGVYQEQLQINPFPGSSCTHTVTFENESDQSGVVYLDFPLPYSPVQISGAQGIIIRNLTISGGTFRIERDTDCISLENNIIRNSVEIREGSDHIRIEGNTITGNIWASSGAGATGSHHHLYKDNIISEGINKLKSISFNPSAPEFDEGLEITGNQLGGRIWLKYQQGIKVNQNVVSIKERITEGAITLENCWYGEEMVGNDISVNGASSGLASGIEAISGIPERVTENRISLSGGPAIEDPGSPEGYSYDYGGGTGMLLSGGKTTNGEVLIANNIITVDGWDRRRAIHSMDGIHLKEGYPAGELFKIYHNSIDIRGFNQEEVYAFHAEPLPANTLEILNNRFIISASYDSPSPAFYTMQIDDHSSIARADYNIHKGPGPDMAIGEHSNPADGKGIYLTEVPRDFYDRLRADPPYIGAVEGEAPDDPTDPTDPTDPGEPLAGTYTIGGEEGDFAGFTEALEALNSRGKTAGEVIFKVRPGTYIEQLSMNGIDGVTFEGETADSTAVVLQYFGTTVLNINSSNVTMRHMTITGTGTDLIRIGSGSMDVSLVGNILKGIGSSVVLAEGITNLKVENNFIQGGEHGTLISSVRSAGLGNMDVHHIFRNNHLRGGSVGISVSFGSYQYSYGLKGLEISGNTLEKQSKGGISLFGQESALVEHNQINVVGKVNETIRGISLEKNYLASRINHNEIHLAGASFATAIDIQGESNPAEIMHNRILLPDGGKGINLSVMEVEGLKNDMPLLVANNLISINANNQSDGIRVNDYGGEVHYFFNSVHLYGEAPLSYSMRLDRYGTESSLANNIFSNKAGGGAIYVVGGGVGLPAWVDYNAYYTKEGTVLMGEHDVFADPRFVSDEDLTPTNSVLDGAGVALSRIEKDFFGNLRNDPPDIGAIEFESDEEEPATPLAGTYTIGGADGDFASLSEAVAALQEKGVAGAITFLIRPGTYSEQLTIGKFPGNSCENPVVFESESGDNSTVFLTASSADFVMKLVGPDGITIRNLNISGEGTLVDIQDGADCISLEHNILTGAEGADRSTLVRAVSGSGNTANHHSYIGNTFIGSWGGLSKVYNRTSSGITDFDEGLLVEGNEFRGTSLSLSGQANYQLNNNRINVANGYEGLTISSGGSGGEVDGNIIQVREAEYGMYIGYGAPDRIVNNQIEYYAMEYGVSALHIEDNPENSRQILIANNLIKVHYHHYFNDYGYSGMVVSGNAKVYHNSVLLSQSFNKKGSVASLYGETVHVFNNNFANLAGEFLVTTNAVAMDYNNLYAPNFDLAEWQSSTGRDEHSISVRPDANTLHPALRGAGVFLEEVPTDISGQTRNKPPTIGAIELGLDPNYTIGGEDGDFASFTEALSFLQRSFGLDSLVFKVRPGTYQEQVHINFQNFRHVTFEGESDDSTDVVLAYPDDYALSITGGSHYTFRHMTISGRGTVRMQAENDISIHHFSFENNVLRSSGDAAVVSTYADAKEGGTTNSDVDFLSIRNNHIEGRGWGLYKEGSIIHHSRHGVYTLSDAGLEVSGNEFTTGRGGMFISNTRDINIHSNKLIVEAMSSAIEPVGIHLKVVSQLKTINDNHLDIRGTGAKGLWIDGSPMGGYFGRNIPDELIGNTIFLPEGGTGIRLEWAASGSYRTPSVFQALVANNMISVKGKEGSMGMQVIESDVSLKMYFNSFSIYGDDDQSKVLSFSDGGFGIELMNNIFANSAGGFTVHGQNTHSQGTAITTPWNHNAYYTNGALFAHWHGDDLASINEWQALTGVDGNSLVVDPQFESGELLIPTNPLLAGAGIWLDEITTDYFGKQRNDPPAIGAVEIEEDDADEPVAVIPFVDCVVRNSDGSYTATFGYDNPNQQAVQLAIGNENFLNLMEYAGQPESFAPGRHEQAFHVVFEASESPSWTLGDSTVTADRKSTTCDSPILPVEPMIECISEISRNIFLATMGYHNPNEAAVAIATGRRNRMLGQQDQGQPAVFESGHHPEVFAVSYTGTLMWNLGDQRARVDRNTPACRPALQAVQPILECVSENGDGTYTAHFGYNNPNNIAVSASFMFHNLLLPASSGKEDLPDTFEPGRHERVFSASFRGQRLEWRLMGNTATATRSAELACGNAANARTASLTDEVIAEGSSLEVYPNPFSKTLQLRFPEQAEERVNVRVFALSGVLLLEESRQYDHNGLKLELDYLSTGTYILEIQTSSAIRRLRVMKQ